MKPLLLALPWVAWVAACGAATPTAARPASMAGRSAPPVASAPGAPPRTAIAPTTPAPAPAPRCPDGMVEIAGGTGTGLATGFCIDRYEAPNVEGEVPFALKTAYDGEAWCADRGKRLCTEDEWVRACEGPDGRTYPYGDVHRASACNDDRSWIAVRWDLLARWPSDVAVAEARRLLQAEASGGRAACVSAEGVHDLTGNVAEWVRRSDPAPRPGYEHVLKGCYWAGCYHEPHPSCVFRNSAHPGTFRTYEAGFRCCADRPEEEPPGTPKNARGRE